MASGKNRKSDPTHKIHTVKLKLRLKLRQRDKKISKQFPSTFSPHFVNKPRDMRAKSDCVPKTGDLDTFSSTVP